MNFGWIGTTSTAQIARDFALDIILATDTADEDEARENLNDFCEQHGLNAAVVLQCARTMWKHNTVFAWVREEDAAVAAAFLRNCAMQVCAD